MMSASPDLDNPWPERPLAPLHRWWVARTARERGLLAVLGLTLLPVAGYAGIVRPMTDATVAARQALVTATERQGRIRHAVDAIADRRAALAARPRGGVVAVDLLAGQTLAERAVPTGGIQALSADGATLTIPAIAPGVLMGWLAELEAQGVVATQATIAPVVTGPVATAVGPTSASVTATLRLERARP